MAKAFDMNVVVKEGGTLPTRGTEGAAGYDLYSPIDFTIPATQSVRGTAAVAVGRYEVDVQVCFQLPVGLQGTVKPRSGLGFKSGLTVFEGTIDSDFIGSVKVLMYNMTGRNVDIKKGDRIAQIVFTQVFAPNLNPVNKLEETLRGDSGFGSTGK